MSRSNIETEKILALSRLFTYPRTAPDKEDLDRVGMEKGAAQSQEGGGLELLQAEYVRLFINALPETPCPPYGSFYLEGTLMGDTTIRLRDLYAGHGFHTEEMEDHISVELEFLALLSMASKQEGVGESLDFLLGHLRSWTPAFLEDIEKADQGGFFGELSKSARNLLLA
ncbi:MAG: molecular chaperone TorD family protein [Desulfobacterales bacterium]|nr:molecular chaperone TorD family protein [Desulfobacterales bacterium]